MSTSGQHGEDQTSSSTPREAEVAPAQSDSDQSTSSQDTGEEKRSGRRPEGPAHPRKGSLVQTLKRTVTEFIDLCGYPHRSICADTATMPTSSPTPGRTWRAS